MSFWEDITGVTAANTAAAAQTAAAQQGIDLQREQFGIMQENLNPYMQAGQNALGGQEALSGALGPEAQAAAIAGIQAGPGFQSQLAQGERSILQNASATGGVRGGNTAGAMAQYSPQLLSQAVNQQYGMLGGLAGAGQNAAAGLGQAGMNMANNVSAGYADIGNAQAGQALGGYNLQKGFLGDMFGGLTSLAGLGIKAKGAGIF